jgi:Ca2+-binding RTX toxin-like protein
VAGTDILVGDGGWDVLVGGFDDGSRPVAADEACLGATLVAGGDVLCGDEGNDVLLGDQGTVTWRRASDLGPQRTVTANGLRNTEPVVFPAGTVVPTATLTTIETGGPDILAGGGGDDRLHGGAGDDLLTGGDGNDALFGGAGLDALWGDLGQDHLFGGTDADWLDVKPRAGRDPATWFVVAPLVDRDGTTTPTNGVDLAYGGWGQDALQGDDSPKGQPGDRLLDWVGSYNVYYVCPGAYGAETIIRSHTPSLADLLRAVAASDGAVDVTVAGASGYTELALVLSGDYNGNSHPIHPDSPGHFTCE